MGTRWRGLLAPINMPTGDGRRFKEGGVTNRAVPLALKWQRTDDQGHDASVVVASLDAVHFGTVKEAIANDWISQATVKKSGMKSADLGAWGSGEWFDDHPELTRLSEDVAEAMLLVERGLLGPSVDAGAAEAIEVREGSDTPLTEDDWDDIYDEWDETGQMPKLEILFTSYEIAAATLVVIPAFAETPAPFEILRDATTEASTTRTDVALVAALTAAVAPEPYPAEYFANPNLTEITPATVDGRRVFGHLARWEVCHVGIPDVCTTAPSSSTDYALFKRYPQNTTGGLVATGRLTTGHGRIGTGCTDTECRGKDDHACEWMSLSESIEHYDKLTTLAWIVVGEDDHGIWFSGVLADNLTAADQRVLGRRMVSGDWRPVGTGHEMTELLALAKEKPGFPLTVSLRDGRQGALVAAGAVNPNRRARADRINPNSLAQDVADLVLAKLRPVAPVPAVTAASEPEHTGAMVALIPSSADATRLAVAGGEPVDELHATRVYLGEAASWPEEQQASLMSAMQQVAASVPPVQAEGFNVMMINPLGPEPCVALGLGGAGLVDAQTAVMEALAPYASLVPEQHAPHLEHVTLQYTPDPARVMDLVDRAGPVTFDRLRVAFAGVATDFPLTGLTPDETEAVGTALSLINEVDLAVADVDPDAIARAAQAATLINEVETANV